MSKDEDRRQVDLAQAVRAIKRTGPVTSDFA